MKSTLKFVFIPDESDQYICEDGADCTFLRDLRGLQPQLNAHWDTKDEPDLRSLLSGFFEYYSEFDFARWQISLREGRPVTKPDLGPRMAAQQGKCCYFLDVENPLQPELNVSANVQRHALDKLVKCCASAAEAMRSGEEGMTLERLFSVGSIGGRARNLVRTVPF